MNDTVKEKETVLTSLISFHVLLNTLLVGFWLFCRSYNGDCSVGGFSYITIALDCNPEYNSNALPFDTLIFAMMTPLVYAYIFTKVSTTVSQLSWMITIAWIATCVGLFNGYNTVISLVIYLVFSAIIHFFQYENQNKIAGLIIKNEDTEMEMRRIIDQSAKDANEMQTRLGNVAHDLKTVL